MMNILAYALFALLTVNTKTLNNIQQQHGTQDMQLAAFNVTHVVLQSILFCGTDIVCDKSILQSLNIPDGLYVPKKCPQCDCHPRCIYDAVEYSFHCCPDYFFQYGYQECKDLGIFSSDKQKLTSVIASCPANRNESVLENCTMIRSEIDHMNTPPVLSQESKRVYQNKYCSICNSEFNYEEFFFELDCPNFEDFNFLSSVDEFFSTAKTKMCRLDFSLPFFEPPVCLLHYNNMISSCNVTGTWRRYDYDIEKACISAYEAFYGIFKNIFCAMCNPPEFIDDFVIDNCTYLYPQNELCLNQPSIEASYPYKNYFCLGCNRVREDLEEYEDVTLDYIYENYLENESMPFYTTLYFKFSEQHILNYFQNADMESGSIVLTPQKEEIFSTKSLNEPGPSLNDDIVNLPNNRYVCSKLMNTLHTFAIPSVIDSSTASFSINITNLMYTSFALTKHGVCTPELLPTYTQLLQRNCSCNVGCTSECCVDFALQQSWTCISGSYPGTEHQIQNEFRVIDGCPFANRFKSFCLQRNSTNFYRAYPVDGLSEFKETYINVFCYLCGLNVDSMNRDSMANFLQKVNPWPLNFKCKKYTNYRNFRNITHLVNHLKEVNCNISFEPPITAMRCSDVCDVDISTCNVTGTWKTFDEDVFNACEKSDIFTFPPTMSNKSVFKNIFCLICNPFNVHHLETNQTCIQEEVPNLVRACEEFPTVHSCSRFKNIFCEECNSANLTGCSNIVYREIKEDPIIITSEGDFLYWSFRFTFSLSSYSDSEDFPIGRNPLPCLPNQMYDGYHVSNFYVFFLINIKI